MIVLFNVYAATLLPLGYLLAFMLVYVHYALFHFGRQNLGVLSFVTLTSMRRPMQRREKLILNGVVGCGMLGALKLFPTVMLDPAKHPIDLALIGRVATVLHDIGYAGYALVLALAAYQFFINRRAYDTYSAIVYWLCVVWYLPIYVALQYPLLSLAAFTTAHGLQYLVFLGMHAYSDARRGLGRRPGFDRTAGPGLSSRLFIAAVPCLLLLAAMYSGYYMWQQSPVLFSDWSGSLDRWFGAGGVATVGASLVAGLTLAHYWVDQFIWRFRSPERKKWLLENFAFLSG